MLVASYASQRWNGDPLNDSKNVELLSKFDYVSLEVTPWAKNLDGHVRADVPLKLRELNPDINLVLYHTTGYDWLGPAFSPNLNDLSARRDIFDLIAKYKAWVMSTDGKVWLPNFNVDLANTLFVADLGSYYLRLLSTKLFDSIFLDCASTRIGWTEQGSGRSIDITKYGSLEYMDSARWRNITSMVEKIHRAGYKVFLNGTGPAPGKNFMDFREGLGSLLSEKEAIAWMNVPGVHWLKAEASSPYETTLKEEMIYRVASNSQNAIVSLGNNREWPPYLIPKG